MRSSVIDGTSHTLDVEEVDEFYFHGWHSWCRTGWADPATPVRPISDPVARLGHDDPVHAADTIPGGSGVGAVRSGDEVVLLGALDPDGWVSLEGGALVGRFEQGSGRWFATAGSHDEVFDAYASALGSSLGARGRGSLSLWCSWYSYYADIDEARIEAALEGVDDLAFDVFQIDDGWQQAIGDWEPNEAFPRGLKDIAGKISETGRTPGLWLAPFIAAPNSTLARRHPEVLLRDAAGDPVVAGENWGAPYFALDVTHPATEAHLRDLFHRVVDWGFGFLKLDFIYAAAYPGRRYLELGREGAYRRALEVIRATVGDSVYLLACGAPAIASVGVCDGLRVGPDVRPESDSRTRAAMATAANRMWMQTVIDTDPDVVFFRNRETDLEPETRTALENLAHISGFRGVSDPPGWLADDERRRLASFLGSRPRISRQGPTSWSVGGQAIDFDHPWEPL